MPRYGWVGVAIMAISEAGVLARVEPFWSWHTPLAWTGYILFVDALVLRRRGASWLHDSRGEFIFLALASIPLWLVFEFYNLYIDNWRYVNLPEPPWRYLGYAWSFATIWPAIFETGDLVAGYRITRGYVISRRQRAREYVLMAIGAAMLVWPILWPSRYLAAPVWLGFIFLLDPINARLGAPSLVADLDRGESKRIGNLALAGLVCGIVWEFWNFWAKAKWVYTVPIMSEVKLFEMPLPGYLGFPAFALECFTMYVFLRRLLWRGEARPISI
jgi:hypothetical protein